MFRGFVLLLALGPLIYYLLALWASTAYFRKQRRSIPIQPDYAPPISILKPVRGLDREAYENFASFCVQDYPEYEVLFCVNDIDDPAVPVIQELQNDFPERRIRLLVGAPRAGASGKVNKLCRLAREASHDLFVISDSDIRVAPSYLREVAAPFADPRVGTVTVFFRSIATEGAGAILDGVGSAVEFAVSALLAQALEGVQFALGATMAIPRQVLSEIGGFEALANHYVDDYEVGHRVAQRGYRVVFAPTPVSMIYPRETLSQFLRHELRWTIGLRNVRPLGHAAVGLILGFPWTLLALFVAPTPAVAIFYLLAYLALRYAVYLTIGAWGLRDDVVRRNWWLAPVRDLAVFGVWIASFFSNRISWRGLEFRVEKGLLIPVRDAALAPVSLLSSNAVRKPVADSFEAAPMLMESLIEVGPRSSSSADLRFSNEPSCVE